MSGAGEAWQAWHATHFPGGAAGSCTGVTDNVTPGSCGTQDSLFIAALAERWRDGERGVQLCLNIRGGDIDKEYPAIHEQICQVITADGAC